MPPASQTQQRQAGSRQQAALLNAARDCVLLPSPAPWLGLPSRLGSFCALNPSVWDRPCAVTHHHCILTALSPKVCPSTSPGHQRLSFPVESHPRNDILDCLWRTAAVRELWACPCGIPRCAFLLVWFSVLVALVSCHCQDKSETTWTCAALALGSSSNEV